jgi:hypothetical protein
MQFMGKKTASKMFTPVRDTDLPVVDYKERKPQSKKKSKTLVRIHDYGNQLTV